MKVSIIVVPGGSLWLERGREGICGPGAGIATGGRARLPRFEIELRADAHAVRTTTPLVWVGLGRGSLPYAHTAERAAGAEVLEVAVVRSARRVGVVC